MDLYFNTKTHKLHILESEDVYSWEEPFCEELVQDFDIDNIKSAYNILYIEGDEPYKTTIKCVENIDTFKHECNKFLEWYNYRSGEDYVLNNEIDFKLLQSELQELISQDNLIGLNSFNMYGAFEMLWSSVPNALLYELNKACLKLKS